MGQRDLSPVKNRPGCQRDLVAATGTLPPPMIHQIISPPISAAGTEEALGPAADREVLLAGPLGGKFALKLSQGLGEWRSGHAFHTTHWGLLSQPDKQKVTSDRKLKNAQFSLLNS